MGFFFPFKLVSTRKTLFSVILSSFEALSPNSGNPKFPVWLPFCAWTHACFYTTKNKKKAKIKKKKSGSKERADPLCYAQIVGLLKLCVSWGKRPSPFSTPELITTNQPNKSWEKVALREMIISRSSCEGKETWRNKM